MNVRENASRPVSRRANIRVALVYIIAAPPLLLYSGDNNTMPGLPACNEAICRLHRFRVRSTAVTPPSHPVRCCHFWRHVRSNAASGIAAAAIAADMQMITAAAPCL